MTVSTMVGELTFLVLQLSSRAHAIKEKSPKFLNACLDEVVTW